MSVTAQNESRLATEYYNSKEYDKAEILYLKLYKKTNAKIYYNYYVNCLIEQEKYEIAEKSVKKQIKKHRDDLGFYVDLGYLYKRQDKLEEANKQYEKAINKLTAVQSQVLGLAGSFNTRREYEYSAEVYLKARYLTGNPYHNELANLYAAQRKYPEMIEEYLELIGINSRNTVNAQNRMKYFVANDINNEFYEALKTALLKKIQKKQRITVYNEMLIWLFVQKKDFNNALLQAKALDKRQHETGKRVFDIAQVAKQNNEFQIAEEAYKYVITKGINKPFYYKARFGLLNVLYTRVVNGEVKTHEQIVALENEYKLTVKELGTSTRTINIIKDLAHLQAFYLNKPEEATELLESVIAVRGLPKNLVAFCKIELGDILVLQNDLWSASLIYGQAEKNNKGTLVADNAKLKKAKLAFYLEDFQWAKAQLDALKSSSSKLVANDALLFSLLIGDNTEEDTILTEMKIYARAELLVFQNKKEKALLALDTIITKYPTHSLVDEAYMLKAKIYEENKEYQKAVETYTKITDDYPDQILADEAVFKLANLYYEKLNDKEKAGELYKKLLLEYTDSIHVTQARKRFREIRDGV